MNLKTTAYFLAAALILTCMPCHAQEVSPLKFSGTEWDFGTIREDGGPVSHVFSFTNTGKDPIAIDRVTASCGCTTPDYTKGLVKPGEKAEIKVSFDPMGYPLDFSKSVAVVSGGGKYHDLLTVRGHVTPRVKTVEEEYPYEMGGGLRFDVTMLAFRQVAQGSASSMVIRYANTSGKAIAIEISPAESSGLLDIHAPETICAGCRGTITATYDLTAKPDSYGVIHDLLKIAVDGKEQDRTIYTTMIGVDDFAGKRVETAPRLFLDAQFRNFGEVRSRKMPYTFRITASNEGKETLYIRSVGEKPGCKTTLRGGMAIPPGTSLPFEVILYSDKYAAGDLSESLIMVVNDPLRTVREIRISAKIIK